MSLHIPSERQEAEVLANYELVQARLSLRHNPYGLVVDPGLPFPPPPFVEGQIFRKEIFSHFNGRLQGWEMFVAVESRGTLLWRRIIVS